MAPELLRKNRCPRCRIGTTTVGYEERYCLNCGWVLYRETSKTTSTEFAPGSKYRYKGKNSIHAETIIRVIPIYRKSGIEGMFVPACPLACGKRMEKYNLANLVAFFRCRDRHVVTVSLEGAETGWR